MIDERRRFKRVKALLTGSISFISGSTKPLALSVTCLDLSPEGALISLNYPLTEGTMLSLSLVMPDGLLSVKAEVMRCEPSRSGSKQWAGLRFITITESDRRRIMRYVFEEDARLAI